MVNKKILLGLTTITPGEWKNKVKEIDELGLKEIALFPTCLDFNARQELYQRLEHTGLEKIPHVHLREQDSTYDEVKYLVEKFDTRVFNIHPVERTLIFIEKLKNFKNNLFIENNNLMPENFEEMVKQCGGLCLDLSHLEEYVYLKKIESHQILLELIKKYKIGINHISGIKSQTALYHDDFTGEDFNNFSCHELADFSELDYLKKYKDYLADYISIELENPLIEQLEVKKYLEKILAL